MLTRAETASSVVGGLMVWKHSAGRTTLCFDDGRRGTDVGGAPGLVG